MSDQSPLTSLVAILSSSVRALEATYAGQGLSYPSLDAPYTPGPLDQDPDADKAARLIVAAAAQIIATVRAPAETVQEYAASSYAAASLNLVLDVHVANILKDAGAQV